MTADAWVVTIGDELLRGEIVDSNKSFLSERLLRLDLEAQRHVTVPDDPAAIEEILREASHRARVVLVSGGLGPTRDDITTEIAARTFARPLRRDAEVLEGIRRFFESVGREMAENNAKQADFPEGAEVLPNPLGTAPGFMMNVDGTLLFFTPGVPRELYRMVDEEILPRIENHLGRAQVVRALLLRTFGLGESTLDRELSDLARDDANVSLGFRTQFPDNLVRVVVRAPTEVEAKQKLDAVVDEIRARLGELILGEGDRFMEEIVGDLLREKNLTLAVAESCTGGRITNRLTDVPGSSTFLLAGIVAYSNAAKVRELDVAPADLEAHGAVSEIVARQMAEGARRRSGADLAVSTTGIAGPAGGSDEKPVGTVYIALCDRIDGHEQTHAQRFQGMRDRERNKELSSQIALEWIRRRLLGLELAAESFPRLGRAPGGRR